MTGLDTNILVRHLTQDDPRLSPIATDIIERRLTIDSPGFVSIVTLVETVWVLQTRYSVTDAEAAAIVEGLITLDQLVVQYQDDIAGAVDDLRSGRLDFSDAIINRISAGHGCSETLTFDRKAARLAGFRLAT